MTTYEFVNGLPPKKIKQNKKKNSRVIAEPPLQAHDRKYTNHTFVLQNNREWKRKSMDITLLAKCLWLVHCP